MHVDHTPDLVPDDVEAATIAHLRAQVGLRYRVHDHYEVGREKIREFARAVQNDHPVHHDENTATEYGYPELVAPPTFSSLLGNGAQTAMAAILTGYDLTTTVQTDQVLHIHRPLIVGDRLTSTISLLSFRQAFGGDLMLVQNTVTDQDDRAVLTAQTSVVARSGPAEHSAEMTDLLTAIVRHGVTHTPPLPYPTLVTGPEPEPARPWASTHTCSAATLSVGDELLPRQFTLKHGDLVNYAGVAGDPNPIHWDLRAATAVGINGGMPAHGMLTMALGAGFITDWLGDPGAIRQYSVRMTSPVLVATQGASTIEFSGRVKSVDVETSTATVAITATQDGRKIFGRATAVVQLS